MSVRVAVFGAFFSERIKLSRYELIPISLPEINRYRFGLRSAFLKGLSWVSYCRSLLSAEMIDELYREKDPYYLAIVENLISRIKTYDIVIFASYCPIHPEILHTRLRGVVKVLGFTDDPYSTYVRGLPYLWAFDAAYYISPSYSDQMSFDTLFELAGFKRRYWLPLTRPLIYRKITPVDLLRRERKIVYVGNPTLNKLDKILSYERAFGSDFILAGRWRLAGLYGVAIPLMRMQRPLYRRVPTVTEQEKVELYLRCSIGLNMHVSPHPRECGNMRTYEIAAHGLMPLSDIGALNLQETIFSPGTECVFYKDIAEAIQLTRYFLTNPHERAQIAFRAYTRFQDCYRFEHVWARFLDWVTEF